MNDDVPSPLSASGYAAAVTPAAASAISTDSVGIAGGAVTIGRMPAYAAMPERAGPFPTVLVVQEIFGVHEHIRDVCRRLAKLGYLAVAPELYYRQGDPSAISDIARLRSTIVSKVSEPRVLADLDAAAAWAAANGGDPARLAVTGFCWGGRITWLYAAHNPHLKAAVAWYGRLDGDITANTPRNPIDVAAEVKAPVLGLYGGADPSIPAEAVGRMQTALAAAGVRCDIVVYPDAPHAFFADYRPSYREEAARDGWRRALDWLKAHGV